MLHVIKCCTSVRGGSGGDDLRLKQRLSAAIIVGQQQELRNGFEKRKIKVAKPGKNTAN